MPKHDHTWLIRLYALGGALLVFWAGLLLYNQFNQHALNSKYIKLGKAVNCIDRPNWETLKRCDARVHIACAEESQTRLMVYFGEIDYACAQFEPAQRFRFPVYSRPEGQEMAEVTE